MFSIFSISSISLNQLSLFDDNVHVIIALLLVINCHIKLAEQSPLLQDPMFILGYTIIFLSGLSCEGSLNTSLAADLIL